MSLPDDDLEWLLEDSGGVEVVHGGVTTSGHRETVEQVSPDGAILGTVDSVVVATSTLSNVGVGDAVTVEGTAYTIAVHEREGDGKLTRLFLDG